METLGHRFASIDDKHHVWGQNERNTIPAKPSKLLSISKKLAKVDVEKVACSLHHDVVIVAISDAHDVGDNTVASTGSCEVVDGSLKLKRTLVVFLQPSVEYPCLEGACDSSCQGLDLSKGFRILHKLNNPSSPPSWNTLKRKIFSCFSSPKISLAQQFTLKETILRSRPSLSQRRSMTRIILRTQVFNMNSGKDVTKYLQSEHVLPQIISNLVNGFDNTPLLLSAVQHQLQRESIAVEIGAVPEDMKMRIRSR